MSTNESKESTVAVSSTSQLTTSAKKVLSDHTKSSKLSSKVSKASHNTYPSSSSTKSGTISDKDLTNKKSSVLTASVTLHSQSNEVVYKIFTYIVIILPTLTSIIFPINTKTVPQNEQIGNFVIDLLTVVLISWVVRFTLEWPYKWMKELETTKTELLQQLNEDDFAIENTDKVVLMVRKINTFQIMALVCCLVSSLLSSVVLIWTRKYTIIDQKRKKMVFNNVNIALLQFWSIFRIIITFTDSLQYSSLSNSNSPLYTQSPSFQTWFTDLKQYFLPNLTNQILLDHLQVHNRQFDRLKLDLVKLQKELDNRDQAQTLSLQRELYRQPKQHQHQQQQHQQQQQQQQKELLRNGKLQSRTKHHSPPPSLLLSLLNNAKTEQQVVTKFHNSISSFSLSAPPPKASPLFSPMQTENNHFQFAPISSLPTPHSFSQTPLKTIVEEDDFIFESLEPPSFNRFEQHEHRLANKTILECTRSVLKSIRNEITILDLFNNPSSVRKVLVTELAFLMNEFRSSDHEIFKVFLMEVIDKYLLSIYVQVMDHLVKIFTHPFRHLMNAIIWTSFKLPIHIAKLYFKLLLMVPFLIVQWFVIKPVKFMALWVSSLMRTVFSLVIFQLATDANASAQSNTVNHVSPSPQKPTHFKPIAQLDKSHADNTQFTMKQFHLSPVLSKDEYFTRSNDEESGKVQAKYKNALLISITPSSTKSSSSIGNGNIPRQSPKLNNAVLYDE